MVRCREPIEHAAPTRETANLLAVTQVLAYLRYHSVELLKALGGIEAMLEIPFLDEIVEKKADEKALVKALVASRRHIATVLEARFGEVPRDLIDAVESVGDEQQLEELVRSAAACSDLAAFRHAIRRG